MEPNLDQYLSDQAASGEQVSEGEFTLAWAKRLEKLREFQLEDPVFYILKLVQAAVCCQPDKIEVAFAANSVRLEFEVAPDFDTLAPTKVVEALTHPTVLQDNALHHLVTALNASLASGPEVHWGSSNGQALRLRADSADLLEDWNPPGKSSQQRRMVFNLRKSKRDHSAEREALNTRCGSGVIPILVDHRPVYPWWPSAKAAVWHADFAKPYYLGKRLLCEEPRALRFPRVNIQGRSLDQEAWVRRRDASSLDATFAISWTKPDWAFSNLEDGHTCAGCFAVPVGLEGPSVIIFVKDGVMLEPYRVPGCDFGGVAVLLGDQVKVDISEFGVLEDQDLSGSITLARAQWQSILNYAQDRVEQLPVPLVGAKAVDDMGGLATLPGLDLVYLLVSAFALMLPRAPDTHKIRNFQSLVSERLTRAKRSM